jgi:hypothetical protein
MYTEIYRTAKGVAVAQISYEIRTVDPRERRTFDDPREAAEYWKDRPPAARLFVVEEGRDELWPGTPAQVKPVYDALAEIRADA